MAKSQYVRCSCGKECRINPEKVDVGCWSCGRVFYVCAVCSPRGRTTRKCNSCVRLSEFKDGGISFSNLTIVI
jgi:hypothetical protein